MKIFTEPIRAKLMSNEKPIENQQKPIENQRQRLYEGIHPFFHKMHYGLFLIKI